MPSDKKNAPRPPEEAQRLAEKILLYSRRCITQAAPFMLVPIYALIQRPRPEPGPLSTDGVHLWYHPDTVIEDFRSCRESPLRQLLHVTLHCLLGHLPARPAESPDTGLFDDAADWKAAQFALALDPRFSPSRTPEREFQQSLPILLRSLEPGNPKRKKFRSLAYRCRVHIDDHSLWNPQNAPALQSRPAGRRGGKVCAEDGSSGGGQEGRQAPDWGAMLQQMAEQTLRSPEWGKAAGILRADCPPAEDSGISYDRFLRRFAAPSERMLLDPDSFDPRWYYLGLEQYGDIPLLEPAEISEPPVPDDLVLALDTSGSCSGEVCRRFLRESLSLLRDISAGAASFRVLALQCDTRIQQELLLETPEQIDSFLEDFRPAGFGGTDFRPVFRRVEELRRQGAMPRVRGLLYLSDGFGSFPERPPDYPVTFLLLEDNCFTWKPDIPDWASALYLNQKDFTLKEART